MNHAWLSEARWLDRRRIERYPKLFVAIFAIAAIAWLVTGDGLRDPSGKPIGSDFIAFFIASEMALAGDAARVYDGAAVHAAERAAFGEAIEFVPWLYPPVFLLLMLPLALLPYGWALGAWIAATLAGYLAVIRRIAPVPQAVWLALAFPAVLVNMGHGQNGFLTMALLGGAVLLLDRRPLVAGALFAALAIKPQLAILVPLALIAAGCWRAIGAAAVCVAAAGGFAAAAFGPEIFATFAANTANAREVLEGGVVGWHKLQSVFAAFRLMGVGTPLAYLAQGMVAAAAAAAVVWVWRRPVSLAVRGATLAAATLLATPFCYDYDLVLLALPIAWIGWEGHRGGFLSWEKAVLAAAWVWPLVARQAALGLGVSLTPVVIAALLALALRRAALAEAGARVPRRGGKDNFHLAEVS